MADQPIQILLVDDHAIVTDGISALLAGESAVQVKSVARNGAEAIEMLRALRLDVVIMDIDMPVMNGMDAAPIIRKEFPDVKLIMLSMHDEKSVIGKMKEAGVHGYLLKNSPKSELMTAISEVMQGREHFSEEVTAVLLSANEEKKPESLLGLTDREIEIIKLIAEGLSNKEIGDRLFISHRTVDTHRTNVMSKLGLHNVAGIVRFAIQNGLMDS